MHKSITIINSFPRTILYVVLAVLLVVTSISLWSSHKAAKAERHIRYVGILNKSDWYVRAKKSNDSFWFDPYYNYDGTTSVATMPRLSSPFSTSLDVWPAFVVPI